MHGSRLISGGTGPLVEKNILADGQEADTSDRGAYGQPTGDHNYENALGDYSYLLVTVSALQLTVDVWQVSTSANSNQPFDSLTVDLQTHQLRR